MKKNISKMIEKNFGRPLYFAIFICLLITLLFTRLYDTEGKSVFGFDQVDNAWAAKNIIVDHQMPLFGMQAKGNTGFFIGPYYYYYLVPFYIFTNLDPVASGYAAGLAAVISLCVIYFIVKNIFNYSVGLWASAVVVFSSYILELDRVQWPINFIVPVSFLIFYSLYKIINKNSFYLLLLAVSFGVSLHLHFTSVFFVAFILLALPFFPWNKKTVRYVLLSIPILLIFITPIIFGYLTTNSGQNATHYLGQSFHGFHLRRLLQIVGDGFIEFNSILYIPYSLYITFFAIGIFIKLYWTKKKENIIFIALASLWLLVPWIVFSTYSGEITNYYFIITRPIAIMVFAYLLYKAFSLKNLVVKVFVILFFVVYSMYNLNHFMNTGPVGLKKHRKEVFEKLQKGEVIEFMNGNPQSYLYYIYKERK